MCKGDYFITVMATKRRLNRRDTVDRVGIHTDVCLGILDLSTVHDVSREPRTDSFVIFMKPTF